MNDEQEPEENPDRWYRSDFAEAIAIGWNILCAGAAISLILHSCK